MAYWTKVVRSFVCFVLVARVGAAAADPAEDRRRADALFAAGRHALTVDNDAKVACQMFADAIRLDPTAVGTMLNLGLCSRRQGKDASALVWFRKALDGATEGPEYKDYRAAAETAMRELVPRVPTLRLEVPTSAGTEVEIDGTRIAPTAYGQLEVDAGEHTIRASAPGKEPTTQKVTARTGEKLTLVTIELRDRKPKVRALATVDRRGPRVRWAWISGGASVVLYSVSLGYGVHLRREQVRALDDRDAALMAGDADGAARAVARHDAAQRRVTYYDTGLFVGATLALAAGVAIYLTAPSSTETRVVPAVGADQVGAVVMGAF